MKVLDNVVQFALVAVPSRAHGDLPENGVHHGREQLANYGLPEDAKQMKRLEFGKHCRRKQRQMVNAFLKPVSIVDRDGGPGIMPHDVPLIDALFYSDFLDLICERFQLVDTAAIFIAAFMELLSRVREDRRPCK